MRTQEQIRALAAVYSRGGSKTAAMIAGGYSPRCAGSNTCKVFPKGSYRHIRFAQGLFMCMNRTQAAIYAGYSPRWAGTNTWRLMRHPAVRAELRRMRRVHYGY